MYEYKCRMIRIVNGNTIEADIDLGFDITIRMNIKLYGVEDSQDAMSFLIKLMPTNFICRTIYNKRGRIGRVLGYVDYEEQDGSRININELMIGKGFSKKLQ